MILYVLDGHEPVPTAAAAAWASWWDTADRVVARSTAEGLRGNTCEVSTVFLGVDHGFGGPPLLFETLVTGGAHDGYIRRYRTWDEAEAGHRQICTAMREVYW